MKNYLEHCTEDEIKRVRKKLKEVGKDTRNGRPRKFFIVPEYIKDEDAFYFLVEQDSYTRNRIKEIKAEGWKFLNDDKETRKGGWYDKKPNPDKQAIWAEQAFPSINVETLDLEFELKILEIYDGQI